MVYMDAASSGNHDCARRTVGNIVSTNFWELADYFKFGGLHLGMLRGRTFGSEMAEARPCWGILTGSYVCYVSKCAAFTLLPMISTDGPPGQVSEGQEDPVGAP